MRKVQPKKNLEEIIELTGKHSVFTGNVVKILSEDLLFLINKCEELLDSPEESASIIEDIKKAVGR